MRRKRGNENLGGYCDRHAGSGGCGCCLVGVVIVIINPWALVSVFYFVGDTANNLGGAMDELMRHQPLLRTSVMSAVIRVSRHFITIIINLSIIPIHVALKYTMWNGSHTHSTE